MVGKAGGLRWRVDSSSSSSAGEASFDDGRVEGVEGMAGGGERVIDGEEGCSGG